MENDRKETSKCKQVIKKFTQDLEIQLLIILMILTSSSLQFCNRNVEGQSFTAEKGHKRHLVQLFTWFVKLSLSGRIVYPSTLSLIGNSLLLEAKKPFFRYLWIIRVIYIIVFHSALIGPNRISPTVSHWSL